MSRILSAIGLLAAGAHADADHLISWDFAADGLNLGLLGSAGDASVSGDVSFGETDAAVGAVALVGDGGYLQLPDTGALDAMAAFGVAAYALDSSSDDSSSRLFHRDARYSDSDASAFELTRDGGDGEYSLCWRERRDVNCQTFDAPPAGTWYHAAVVCDGETMTAYIDGVAQASVQPPASSVDIALADVTVGTTRGWSDEDRALRVAQFVAFDYAASEAEICALAAATCASAAPDAPTDVAAAPVSDGALLVTWSYESTTTTADGFAVAVGDVSASADGDATELVVDGLTLGQAYDVAVAAVSANGATSEWAEAAAAATAIAAPAAPGDVAAAAGDGEAVVSWTASDWADSYTVSPGDVATTGTSATLAGLDNGVVYEVTVTAHNALGEATSAVAEVRPVSAEHEPVPCAEDCLNGGECDTFDGTCACPDAYAGAACAELAGPALALTLFAASEEAVDEAALVEAVAAALGVEAARLAVARVFVDDAGKVAVELVVLGDAAEADAVVAAAAAEPEELGAAGVAAVDDVGTGAVDCAALGSDSCDECLAHAECGWCADGDAGACAPAALVDDACAAPECPVACLALGSGSCDDCLALGADNCAWQGDHCSAVLEGGAESCDAWACAAHGDDCGACVADEACGWCASSGACLAAADEGECAAEWTEDVCPEACAAETRVSADDQGEVSHGAYPAEVAICEWRIEADGDRLALEVGELGLADGDSLIVRDAESEETLLWIRNDNGQEFEVESWGDEGVTLTLYTSDASREELPTGFRATWSVVDGYSGGGEDDDDSQYADEEGDAPAVLAGMQAMAGAVGFSAMVFFAGRYYRRRAGEKRRVVLPQHELEIQAVVVTAELEEQKAANEDMCAICLGGFVAGEDLRELSCAHAFHDGCIQLWLDQAQRCPLCNQVPR